MESGKAVLIILFIISLIYGLIWAKNKEKTNKTIGMIDPPYELKKKPNDSIFLVLKKNDSFYFSMIDYSKSRFKDPTFGQLLKRLLQE